LTGRQRRLAWLLIRSAEESVSGAIATVREAIDPISSGGSAASIMAEVKKDQDQIAYNEGVFVRALGRPLGSNPYPPHSIDARLWTEGWRLVDGHRDNTTRYDRPPPTKPVPEVAKGTPIIPPQKQGSMRPSRRIFILYFALILSFGGFFLLTLFGIGRLIR
jgi:hypothetical protein